MKHKKKKRHSQSSAAPEETVVGLRSVDAEEEERRKKQVSAIHTLSEAFSLTASLDDAVSAYDAANGDLHKAAEILVQASWEGSDAPSTSSVSGEASSSGSSRSSETSCVENMVMTEKERRRNKQKRVVAATGTVSTVLGRGYLEASPRKTKLKGFDNGVKDRERDEQFLVSMLGDESELNLAIVRDVLCQCAYDVEKALNVLLDLSASGNEQSMSEDANFRQTHKDDIRYHIERCETLTDMVSDCSSHSSECEIHDSIWSIGCSCSRGKSYAGILASSEARPSVEQTANNLSQRVLESFYNISKSSEHEPSTMSWRSVVSKLKSLGPEVDISSTGHAAAQQIPFVKGDEYQAFRKTANEKWESVRSCYAKAAKAYSNGSRDYAAYISNQGKSIIKLAREADERASKDIFKARNKDIQNIITIDMHGQHVKQAMRMLKMHLLMVSYVQSVQVLRVITGCGTHGMGKSKVKQSVIKLLEDEGIKWTEENRGTVLIKLCGQKEFNFLDSGSDLE